MSHGSNKGVSLPSKPDSVMRVGIATGIPIVSLCEHGTPLCMVCDPVCRKEARRATRNGSGGSVRGEAVFRA